MGTPVILSPEQQRAKEFYKSTLGSSFFVSLLLVYSIFLPLELLAQKMGWESAHTSSEFGALLFMLAIQLTKVLAVWRVRSAGFSLESKVVEVVPKTATVFSGAPVEWRHPTTILGRLGSATAPFLGSALGWYLWHFEQMSWLLHFFGALEFVYATLSGVVGLLFINAPQIRVDEQGIIGFQMGWRRRASWRDVASCKFLQVTNFSGDTLRHWFIFKDAKGKTLLRLSPWTLQSFTSHEREAIAAEIKRRLTSNA